MSIKQLLVLSRLRGMDEAFLKEVKKMPATINIEKDYLYQEGKREGERRGLLEAIELGLELKFGVAALGIMEMIKHIEDNVRLEEIKESIKTANTVNDIKSLYE